MGSGSSSNVQPISSASVSGVRSDGGGGSGRGPREGPAGVEGATPSSTSTSIEFLESPQKQGTLASTGEKNKLECGPISEITKERDILAEQVTTLQTQVGDLESQNLDLVEQIQILEEQLEKDHAQEVTKSNDVCANTVAAKDQYIQKLEKETKLIQEEISKLKIKQRKKIRILNSQITEAKHETSLHAFEMKDEVQKLREENLELIDKIKQVSCQKLPLSARPSSSMDQESAPGRANLIVDLSTRVSEQENKIIELELKLGEKDKVIEELKAAKKRTSSSKGKRTGSAKSHVSIASDGTPSYADQDGWSADVNSLVDNDENHSNNNYHNDFNSTSESASNTSTRKSKKKQVPLHQARDLGQQLGRDGIPDSRESSGTSRDSGFESLHSADKNTSSKKWLKLRAQKQGRNKVKSGTEEGLDLVSIQGSTPGPSTGSSNRPVSPISEASRWSDDEHWETVERGHTDVKSTISQSSIRRISAPKKKKKHAVFDPDLLMDNLLKDMDAPFVGTSVSALNATNNPLLA